MIHYTQNYSLAYADVDTPLKELAAVTQQVAASVDEALTAGGVTPPGAAELVELSGIVTALQGTVDALPRGRVAGGVWSAAGPSGITTETMIDSVTFTAVAGRRYRVTYSASGVVRTAGAGATFRVRSAAGASVAVASTLRHAQSVDWTVVGVFYHSSVDTGEIVGLAAGQTTIGVSIGRLFGTGNLEVAGDAALNQRKLIVEDIGRV